MFTAAVVLGLGCSRDTARGLACGTGTIERDGFCVVAAAEGGSATNGGPEAASEAAQDAAADDCSSPITFYKDNDGDGVGGEESTTACRSPGRDWVTESKDCDDSDPLVHPGAIAFHTTPTKAGSFDYDCDGIEMPNPSAKVGDPGCSGAYPNCPTGEGYLYASISIGRDGGAAANYYCGSTNYRQCGVGGNPTTCMGYNSQRAPLACR